MSAHCICRRALGRGLSAVQYQRSRDARISASVSVDPLEADTYICDASCSECEMQSRSCTGFLRQGLSTRSFLQGLSYEPPTSGALFMFTSDSRVGPADNCLMLELAVLFISTLPFLLGLYALKVIERRRNDGGDSPPPPDSDPPAPVSPSPVAPVRHVPGSRPRSNRSGDRGPARRSSRTPVVPARPANACIVNPNDRLRGLDCHGGTFSRRMAKGIS